jgi:hypothetical protein
MSGPGSSAWLKKELDKREQNGEVRTYSEEETANIVNELNEHMEQYRIEANRMFAESERDAAKVFITC